MQRRTVQQKRSSASASDSGSGSAGASVVMGKGQKEEIYEEENSVDVPLEVVSGTHLIIFRPKYIFYQFSVSNHLFYVFFPRPKFPFPSYFLPFPSSNHPFFTPTIQVLGLETEKKKNVAKTLELNDRVVAAENEIKEKELADQALIDASGTI